VISYRSAITYLYGLQYRGMKFGLRNIRTLLADVGNPEEKFPSIHIAGTNGKGSTASCIASVCMQCGLKTGLYTSPHLVRFTERIRIDGKEIGQARIRRYVDILRPSVEAVGATFFEATTCMAFLYFAEEDVDIGVIETGLGGRLDATNTLVPLVSVITNIAREHTEYLGSTIQAIAREKAGIIKSHVPVITASGDPAVIKVIRHVAAKMKAPVYRSEGMARVISRGTAGKITIRSGGWQTRAFLPGLAGRYQHTNFALAVGALLIAGRRLRPHLRITPGAVEKGIAGVCRNTGLAGRMQLMKRGSVLLDVAHNAAGMKALVEDLRAMQLPPRTAVIGVMRDKDRAAMLKELGNEMTRIIVVAPGIDRAVPAPVLFREGKGLGLPVVFGGTVRRGVRLALKNRGKERIVITGSHFVVGEALKSLEG